MYTCQVLLLLFHANNRLPISLRPVKHTRFRKNLLPPEVQASEAWLGGGEKSGAAKILKATAEFLKEQGKISEVLPSYAAFVTPDALALTN